MEPRDHENSLSKTNNSAIQKHNKDLITSAVSSVVKAEESVKTYLHAESIKSLIINAEHGVWSEWEDSNG